MVSHIALFLLGLVLLAKGADYFVEYAARLAKRFGVSDFIIGLTITSVGTSIPELAAGVSASVNHYSGIVIGNVVGSNIANIGLILGLSAAVKSFQTDRKMYARDGYIMIASVLLFFAFVLNNEISTTESIIFLLAYVFYIFFIISSEKEEKAYQFRDFMKYVFDFKYVAPVKSGISHLTHRKKHEDKLVEEPSVKFSKAIIKEVLIIVLSCLAVMFGAKYLVNEAVWLAKLLNVPESVIGLSMIAVGTSLPELTVSLSAARKGRGGMVVGNILGSNIANILLIIGVSGTIYPLQVAEISVVYTIPIMLFFSLALLYFIKSNWQIARWQGIVIMIAYVVFMTLAFLKGWS